jgi:SH3-like domain-containing protein
MANKKGRSEKKTTFFGKEYIQHYDSKGNKSGRSEKKPGFFGNSYTQHYNDRGEKRGHSEKKETWLGREYTQKYNSKGDKSGKSEKKETWYGKRYTQHYDSQGNKTDRTERKETWYGKPYVQRYGETSKTSSSTYSSPGASSSYGSGGGSSATGSASGSTSSSSFPIGCGVVLGVLFLAGFAILIGSVRHNSTPSISRNESITNAYVSARQLNLRSGPGSEYAVVTKLSRGDAVACLERSASTSGQVWIRVRNGSYDGWVNEKFLSQSPPQVETPAAEQPPAIPEQPQNEPRVEEPPAASAAPFMVNVMRFYEGGPDVVPVGQRFYSTRFAAAQSRFIFWELNLVHANPHQRSDFTIHAIWKNLDGSVVAEQDLNAFFESNQTSSEHSFGWGSQTAGWWRPGKYTVELYSRNSLLATRSFEIY